MEKKNMVLLTVIAVATLLVAVVGATFAFYTAQQKNTTETMFEVNTATADVFTAIGSGTVSIDITSGDMQEIEGNNDYSVFQEKTTGPGDKIVISLNAGSGTATCTYDLYYAAKDEISVFYPSQAAQAGSLLEYTVRGTNGTNTLAEVNLANIGVAAEGTKGTKLNTESFTITDKGGSGNEEPTTVTWDLTTRFYNLAVDQTSVAGKSFGGVVQVGEATCINTNN